MKPRYSPKNLASALDGRVETLPLRLSYIKDAQLVQDMQNALERHVKDFKDQVLALKPKKSEMLNSTLPELNSRVWSLYMQRRIDARGGTAQVTEGGKSPEDWAFFYMVRTVNSLIGG